MIHYTEIERNGERIVKTPLNLVKTRHYFCYKYKGKYFVFFKNNGLLVNKNEIEIKDGLVKGGRLTTAIKEWFNSSLNEWFFHESKLYDGRYTI